MSSFSHRLYNIGGYDIITVYIITPHKCQPYIKKAFRMNRLKELREILQLTQAALAEKTGLYQTQISVLENKNTPLSPYIIDKLIKAFGVSRQWLEDGTGEIFAPDIPPKKQAETIPPYYYAKERGLDEQTARAFDNLCSASPEQKKAVESFIQTAAGLFVPKQDGRDNGRDNERGDD